MTTLVGPCALNFSGLVAWYSRLATTTTHIQELDGKTVFNCVLFYIPEVDEDMSYIRDTIITMFSPARRPTPERALIDYMRHLDLFEEFYFVEGLRNYVDTHPDLSLLRVVAAHYGVSQELEDWLVEIQDYSDCE